MGSFNFEKFATDVFDPQKGEKFLVMRDVPCGDIKDCDDWKSRRLMAENWWRGFDALSKKLGFDVQPLLDYKATGADNANLPTEVVESISGEKYNLEDKIKESDVVVVLSQFSASAPLIGFIKKYPKLRGASMPHVQKEMEDSALAADYRKIADLSHKIRDHLLQSIGADVFFDTGHKCFFDLRGDTAIADDGMLHVDKTGLRLINLPSGEAFCVPKETFHGGDSLTKGDLPFRKHNSEDIIVFKIENNLIREIVGNNKLADEQRAYFAVDPARCNIAEFGLGCNDKAIIRDNNLEDEKAGFHWAIGRSDHIGGTVGVASFKSPANAVHYDNIYAKGCPIVATKIILHKKDGSKYEIWDGNWYIV